MDRERFDALARLFATSGSRRAALGALFGAGLFGTSLEAIAKKGKSNGNGRGGGGKGKGKDRGKDRGKSKDRGNGKSNGKNRKNRAQAEQLPANCCSTNNCTPGKGKNLGKCCYEDQNLANANFSGANVGNANFDNAILTNANFSGANLGKTCFVDADLTGAQTKGANLGTAIFCRTTMPDGSINNSGCNRGNRCCQTCVEVGGSGCEIGGECCGGAECDDGTCVCPTGTELCDDGVCRECCDDGVQSTCDTGETCCEGVCSPGLTCVGEGCLPITATSGDVSPDPDGGLVHTTQGPAAFGASRIQPPAGTTFGQLASMEADFDFATGVCGTGTPRFVVFLTSGRCPYAAFPQTGDCTGANASGNTGNFIGNNVPFVWNDDLCGGNSANNTYAEVLTAYGGVTIDRIALVVDESNGEQTVTLDPCVTLALLG